MKTIYRPTSSSTKVIWFFFCTFLFINILFGLASTGPTLHLLKIILVSSIFYLGFPFLSTHYTYVEFNVDKFQIVKFFFLRKTILISEIQELRTDYSVGGLISGIQICYKNKNRKSKIEMGSVPVFGSLAIAEILRKLSDINPNIKLDKKLEELTHKFSK